MSNDHLIVPSRSILVSLIDLFINKQDFSFCVSHNFFFRIPDFQLGQNETQDKQCFYLETKASFCQAVSAGTSERLTLVFWFVPGLMLS